MDRRRHALPHLDLLLPNRTELRALARALGAHGDGDEDLARSVARITGRASS